MSTQEDNNRLDKQFTEAKAKKLWFWHMSGIWASPEELRATLAKEPKTYGLTFKLRDPRELMAEINLRIAQLQQELKKVERTIAKEQGSD